MLYDWVIIYSMLWIVYCVVQVHNYGVIFLTSSSPGPRPGNYGRRKGLDDPGLRKNSGEQASERNKNSEKHKLKRIKNTSDYSVLCTFACVKLKHSL